MKERLWPAGIAALAMHGLMIAAMALGVPYPKGVSPQGFRVEVMFVSESGQEKRASELLTSPLVGEADSKRREEADGRYLSLGKKHQRRDLSAAAYSPPVTPFRSRVDLSPNRRGKQSIKASANPIPSEGEHPSGEPDDAIPIFNPPPLYPYEAKRKRIQGVVLVQLSLTATGIVHKAITLPPRVDPLLEDAALSAAYTWRFKPGARILEVPIEFRLET